MESVAFFVFVCCARCLWAAISTSIFASDKLNSSKTSNIFTFGSFARRRRQRASWPPLPSRPRDRRGGACGGLTLRPATLLGGPVTVKVPTGAYVAPPGQPVPGPKIYTFFSPANALVNVIGNRSVRVVPENTADALATSTLHCEFCSGGPVPIVPCVPVHELLARSPYREMPLAEGKKTIPHPWS